MRRFLFWLQRKKRRKKRDCEGCCLNCRFYRECINDGEFKMSEKSFLIENENFVIRPIEENDKEQVKLLVKENRFLKKLWNSEPLKDIADSVIERVFLDPKSIYGIISKETNKFCGYMEISPEKDCDEGELSIRLLDEADMCEVMKILGGVFEVLGYKEAKNITIEYSFE